MKHLKGHFTDAVICTDLVDSKTLDQVHDLINNECSVGSKVVIMADCHAGMGCVIGTTMTIHDRVVPNLVGVDIGCGMLTLPLGNIEIDYEKLDKVIRAKIPSGHNIHNVNEPSRTHSDLNDLRCFEATTRDYLAIGTLGGGNHFIEIDVDYKGNKYLIIHSGSRNLGKRVADHYTKLALTRYEKEQKEHGLEYIKANYPSSEWQNEITKLSKATASVNKDLLYLTGEDMANYLHDMEICQGYALFNRLVIAWEIFTGMKWDTHLKWGKIHKNIIHTIHNYIEIETKILRKGAIRALKDELCVIPINMRDGVLLVKGKGNVEYNCSAPHGAGRILSRSQARKNVNLDDFKESMKGIYSTSVNKDTIDESPMVYKPIEAILDNIKEMVDVVEILKPVYNFKATEEWR